MSGVNRIDWMGQRITPDDGLDADYCKRHRRIVSAQDGCEQCSHEAMAEDADDYRREVEKENR